MADAVKEAEANAAEYKRVMAEEQAVITASKPEAVRMFETIPPPPVITGHDLFIPTYRRPWTDILAEKLREFWFKGGRASFKSTFIAEVIVIGMMNDARKALKAKKSGIKNWKRYLSHAVVYRKYGVDIHDSVFENIRWVAKEKLGYGNLWHFSKTGRKATFIPTGQQIIFRGLDDVQKQKSIKAPFGWFKYLWFEELTEFSGPREIRSVKQSVQRGGHHFITLASYNPPPTPADWVNVESVKQVEGRAVYHSTFLDAAKYAPEWLGENFFQDAKALLETDQQAFEHEYLGKVTGTGAEVFRRIKTRTITDEEINGCTVIRHGLDFGFESDPCALMSVAYDAKKKTLYIFGEWVQHGKFEEDIFEEIKRRGLLNKIITADCAEKKAIARLNRLGAGKVQPCTKGPNSVEDGLHWLKSLRAIIIDPAKCPVAVREWTRYAYKRTRAGDITSQYVDADNHTIDAVRYALESEIRYGDAPHKWGVV